MSKYAIIKNNMITNVILANTPEPLLQEGETAQLVSEITGFSTIGSIYDSSLDKFVSPLSLKGLTNLTNPDLVDGSFTNTLDDSGSITPTTFKIDFNRNVEIDTSSLSLPISIEVLSTHSNGINLEVSSREEFLSLEIPFNLITDATYNLPAQPNMTTTFLLSYIESGSL